MPDYSYVLFGFIYKATVLLLMSLGFVCSLKGF